MAAVGLLESVLTAHMVDGMTDTPSSKSRETARDESATKNADAALGAASLRQTTSRIMIAARGPRSNGQTAAV
jgi:hypothetical protein